MQPVVWGTGLLCYWAGQLLDAASDVFADIDLLNLTDDDE